MTTQVIVSTQSSVLLDHFDPEDVLVADRVDGGTKLARLESEPLKKWLEDYSLGQLWEKNETRRKSYFRLSTMARVLIHVEGWTERTFVNEVLRNHLAPHLVSARIIGNARQHDQRGGIRSWTHVKKASSITCGGIVRASRPLWSIITAMPLAWPGRAQSTNRRSTEEKARLVEKEMGSDLAAEMGSGFDSKRFLPFVVMHEFEGLAV